jgi:phycobilisome core-membrane linker protein
MAIKATSGSNVARPRRFNTVMVETIDGACTEDRYFSSGELESMKNYFNEAQKRLAVSQIIISNAESIVSRAATRIFQGGSPMAYAPQQLQRPKETVGVGGRKRSEAPSDSPGFGDEVIIEDRGGFLERLKGLFASSGETVTSSNFQPIRIALYGAERMQKSLRDLDWFLRYVNYALLAGDFNILELNCTGLREILERACSIDATIVAIQEMRRAAVGYLKTQEDKVLVGSYFDVIVRCLEADKSDTPGDIIRPSTADRPGLQLPYCYSLAGQAKRKFRIDSATTGEQKELAIKAAYRQVFERDIRAHYGQAVSYLESKVKSGEFSVREFIRGLGKSELYRKQFFEPFIDSRALELAFKHFLGRAPESRPEVQKYFSIVAAGGLYALVDSLIDSDEYQRVFGEDTVPYIRDLGQEAQPSWNWGAAYNLYNYAAPRRKVPEFITLFADYTNNLPNQHPYGAGNDPLEIQFGAIFNKESKNLNSRPALIGKDVQRILIRTGVPFENERGTKGFTPTQESTLGPKIFTLSQNPSQRSARIVQNAGVVNVEGNTQAVIRATYLQVFGRAVYSGQEQKVAETKLENGEISVREFVRRVAKSEVFRSLYWTPLYVCKSIEYIHKHLLGRLTYGRQETDKYYNIAYRKGFYGVVDAIIDSPEYDEVYGEDTVPYERYVSPRGLALRTLRGGAMNQPMVAKADPMMDMVMARGVAPSRSLPSIQASINQGVSRKRDQTKVFQYTTDLARPEFDQLLRAVYRQVFERDMDGYRVSASFSDDESKLRNGEISVREFVRRVGTSELYRKQFFDRYPNTQVTEIGLKHFLGRATKDQAELRRLGNVLAKQGFKAFVGAIIDSPEYDESFGEDVVPYRRYPTLPATNFPNTETLFNRQTFQTKAVVVPSFAPLKVRTGMSMDKMPMVESALVDVQKNKTRIDPTKPLYLELGKSLKDGGDDYTIGTRRNPLPMYMLTDSSPAKDRERAILAAYRQVFERDLPEGLRLSKPESRLKNGEINVREFIRTLGKSETYRKQFFDPYPNTKVTEFNFKHFLGRAPSTQEEIQFYNQIFATKGLAAAVDAMLNSEEYLTVYGENTVPYRRYPTLPIGTYTGSVATNDELIQQSWSSLSPSYLGFSFSR